MKRLALEALGIVVVLLLSTVATQAAVEPVGLYDPFDGEQADPDRWFASLGSTNPGIVETRVKVENGVLNLVHRAFAGTTSDSGFPFSATNLNVSNPESVTAMKSRIRINAATTTNCAANPGTIVSARLQLVSFNTLGNVFPNVTGDVQAHVRVLLRAGDPQLVVQGQAFECLDATCSQSKCIAPGCVGDQSTVELGTVGIGEWVTVLVGVDFANDRLVFQQHMKRPQTISYAGSSDANPAAGPVARVRVASSVPNCVPVQGEARPDAFMDADFDDVQLNQSALP